MASKNVFMVSKNVFMASKNAFGVEERFYGVEERFYGVEERFYGVRFIWEHFLAFVPIINDGNIFWTKNVHFWDTLLQFFTKIFGTEKGSDPFDPVTTKYYELEDETICIEQPTIAALQCIKNQLPTRSGSIYMDQSL